MTMIFKKAIARRTFLRGVGTTLALPLLDGMVPAFAAGSDPAQAVRTLFMYGPNGRIMKNWTPTIDGSGWEMTPTLEPLAPFRDQMQILSGLDVKAADPWEGEPGGVHARPCAAYLTGIHPKPDQAMGISVDQYIAKEFGKHTQLGSLEISMESSERVGAADGAYSDSYSKTIAWRGPETPLPMEHNPRRVFERLLGENQSTDPAMRRRIVQKNRSILDFVTGEVARLSAEIGPSDRVLHVLPVFHAHGLFVAAAMPLLQGASVMISEAFDAAQTARLLPEATVFMAVPAIYTRLLAQPEERQPGGLEDHPAHGGGHRHHDHREQREIDLVHGRLFRVQRQLRFGEIDFLADVGQRLVGIEPGFEFQGHVGAAFEAGGGDLLDPVDPAHFLFHRPDQKAFGVFR